MIYVAPLFWPQFGFPHGDARLDFTDLFAFPKPGDARTSVLIMDVHPSVGVIPPGPTAPDAFAPDALYEIKVDTNGDTVADIAYRVRFSSAGRDANGDRAPSKGRRSGRGRRRRYRSSSRTRRYRLAATRE